MNNIVAVIAAAEYPAFVLCKDCDQWECIQCRTETCEGCPSPYTNGES